MVVGPRPASPQSPRTPRPVAASQKPSHDPGPQPTSSSSEARVVELLPLSAPPPLVTHPLPTDEASLWTMLKDLLADYISVDEMDGTTWDEEMGAAMATVWLHIRQLRNRELTDMTRRFLAGKEIGERIAELREKEGSEDG
eukprot:GFKZ01006143.1.p1 GENE.GFKZ01006143.1~~GFKZ01006143.1.p1  ORF type:complete len:141 (-),score=20.60 GFKZ01006143.1:870-1292(-)